MKLLLLLAGFTIISILLIEFFKEKNKQKLTSLKFLLVSLIPVIIPILLLYILRSYGVLFISLPILSLITVIWFLFYIPRTMKKDQITTATLKNYWQYFSLMIIPYFMIFTYLISFEINLLKQYTDNIMGVLIAIPFAAISFIGLYSTLYFYLKLGKNPVFLYLSLAWIFFTLLPAALIFG